VNDVPDSHSASGEPTLVEREFAGAEIAPASSRAANVLSRSSVMWAGWITLASTAVAIRLESVPLPYDATYESVTYLMWSANAQQMRLPEGLIAILLSMAIVVPVFLISWAVIWPRTPSLRSSALVQWSYRFALFWPLILIVSTALPRGVANLAYAGAQLTSGDMTPVLARLEGPLLEWLQRHVENHWLSAVFADIYSWVWIIVLLGFGPGLVLRGRAEPANQVIVATILAALLAIPFFILLPVVDPWATNTLYGYTQSGQTAVRYLYPDPDLTSLSRIATQARLATGSCFPSLHVALPLVFTLVAIRHRLRVATWVLATVTAATSVAVVYLGRHWIMDVIAAVPFAFAIQYLVERINLRLPLSSKCELAGGE
jgi:PAP2 superfamily protein